MQMDYNHIESFLNKFKKLISGKEITNKIITETITKHISFTIDPKMIKTKGDTILIQGSPMLRSEVLMHTQDILLDLKQALPNHEFKSIR
jgi:hypothetical protein